jgi:hypothetical protein
MKKIFFAAASLFTLSLFGCAVDTQSTDGASTTEALGHGHVVGVGQHCGGFTTNPNTCDRGLKCVLGRIADLGGTCQYAEYNESCGGFIANPVQCDSKAGLQCSHVDAKGNRINPDVAGVCLEARDQACGGNMTTAKACAEGLTCQGGTLVGDVGGKCEPPPVTPVVSGYDGPCGGFIANAPVCGDGLQCSHVDANGNVINPDLAGVCLEARDQACGGNMTTAKVCAEGLTCQGGTLVGDVGGTCQ